MTRLTFVLIIFLSLFVSAKESSSLSSGKIQARLNHVNGYSAECVMHRFYSNSGWIQLEGEVGRNGIDGLYYKKKNGVIKEVLVAESKWNTSRLGRSGKNKLVLQMSQEWVLRTLYRLQKYRYHKSYATIKQFVLHNQYRARLFKLLPLGEDKIQIHIYKIKNKGSKAYEKLKESTLKPIVLNGPRNSFEKGMVKAYNNCRTEALEKYFPMLDNSAIQKLLLDNYLKKSDIKKYL